MSELVSRHRPEAGRVLVQTVWALGAAGLGVFLLDLIAAAGIGAGMFVVVTMDLGPGLGIPVYITSLFGVVVAFAAVIHFAVALLERALPVPPVVWLALAVHPAALLALELFDAEGVYEPTLGIAGALGVCIAWLTTRWQRARQTSPSRSASNAPER